MKNSSFQFLNPYLEELYFFPEKDFIIENGSCKMKNSYNVMVTKEESSNQAKVELKLEINMDNDEPSPFKLRITMASDFKWEKDVGEDAVETLLRVNAPALLLGYMRPIVANITGASLYPAYNIPFMNFNDE